MLGKKKVVFKPGKFSRNIIFLPPLENSFVMTLFDEMRKINVLWGVQ